MVLSCFSYPSPPAWCTLIFPPRGASMTHPTRRTCNQHLLGTLAAYGLIQTFFHQDALAESVKPVIKQWMNDLNTLSKDLKADRKLKDTEFQTKLEELYKRVNLPELLGLLDL